MRVYIIWSVLLCMTTLVASYEAQIFDVVNYGAIGDGVTDDSKAFRKAWEEVCKAESRIPTLIVPPLKEFMLKPVSFKGPCKTNHVHFQIMGKIIAPEKDNWGNKDQHEWLVFRDVDGLTVSGNGTIDGRGAAWWESCSKVDHVDDCPRPTALRITNSKNLCLVGLTHINSQRNHISIHACNNASIRDLHIQAPETSPNTDGIDISESTDIKIHNLIIGTGDDCIAINNGSSFINITKVKCGPGHGISVGSLGKNGEYDGVENIYVKNCSFTGTTNGVRIKTWKGGSGYARKIQFENITFVNTKNPIVIDQFYCPHRECKASSPNAITFNCSSLSGCTGIKTDGVHISSVSKTKEVYSICNNVQGEFSNTSPPVKCGNSTNGL